MLPGERGEIAGMLLFTLGIVLWILIPFYDKNKESGRRARLAHYFGLLAVFALVMPRLSSATGLFARRKNDDELSILGHTLSRLRAG